MKKIETWHQKDDSNVRLQRCLKRGDEKMKTETWRRKIKSKRFVQMKQIENVESKRRLKH